MFLYVNGAIVSKEQAMVSVFDHGYMYGLGVFETFRVDNGHPFLLDDHFQRLREGLMELGVNWTMTKEEILHVIDQLLQANQLESAYVRWNVAAGPQDLGLYTGEYTEPTTIVFMKPLPASSSEKDATILAIKRNTPEGVSRLKSHHYLNNVLAKRELGDANKDKEGIFLTKSGFVAEGIVSNVFWVKDKVVYTPAVETGILNGITRLFVLKLLHKKAVRVEIGYYPEQQLLQADEAFITNSIQEIVSLRSIDDYEYKGRMIADDLRQAFHKYREKLWSRSEVMEE